MLRRVAGLGLLLILSTSACATLFGGGAEELNLRSRPGEADVYVNNAHEGVAPVRVRLDPSKSHTVTMRKEGFSECTLALNTHVQAGWVVLDILGGVLPVAVDAATGDWKTFDERTWWCELEKEQESNP